ncbi:type II secretion system protein GspF, partial [Gilvimarinus sp. 1_MG-2023]|nr:type II secretion system protein GspF [Gilvimarinus sp. 1_MG-2023]
YILLAVVAVAVLFGQAMRSPAFREKYHRFMLAVPGIGGFAKDANTARFGSTLAILTSSGVPLVDAMRIASQVVDNI